LKYLKRSLLEASSQLLPLGLARLTNADINLTSKFARRGNSSQIITLPITRSQTRNKRNKDTPKGGIVCSERVVQPGFDMGRY
jgi:hypothetical protein